MPSPPPQGGYRPTPLPPARARAHPHGHRRSSGSDVSDRKVLADIDWWRVTDGQRERGGEEEGEEEGEGEERDVVGEENPRWFRGLI